MKFVDEVSIKITSGNGGSGCASFLREKYRPRGGPDGGHGGKGGDVIIKTSGSLNSLIDFRPKYNYAAKNGGSGSSRQKDGACGEDMILEVPVGTVVVSDQGEILADFEEIQETIVLHGGRGGKGNTFFKTSVNQAPEHFQPGEEGESRSVSLELKLIADVGIIGLPNAGKSTLIAAISAARPKIAGYPFTTLTPNLGVVKVGEGDSFVVADIPGLIEGAHQGVGLGHQFLRHVERTRLLVHLIDISPMSEKSPVEAFDLLNYELEQYDRIKKDSDGFVSLFDRKQIVVFNKLDSVQREEGLFIQQEFEKKRGIKPLILSAVSGQGLKPLIEEMGRDILGKN